MLHVVVMGNIKNFKTIQYWSIRIDIKSDTICKPHPLNSILTLINTLFSYFLKNKNMFTFLGLSLFRFADSNSPVLLKSLSKGTDVATLEVSCTVAWLQQFYFYSWLLLIIIKISYLTLLGGRGYCIEW